MLQFLTEQRATTGSQITPDNATDFFFILFWIPDPWGNGIQSDVHSCSNGLVQPPTSFFVWHYWYMLCFLLVCLDVFHVCFVAVGCNDDPYSIHSKSSKTPTIWFFFHVDLVFTTDSTKHTKLYFSASCRKSRTESYRVTPFTAKNFEGSPLPRISNRILTGGIGWNPARVPQEHPLPFFTPRKRTLQISVT